MKNQTTSTLASVQGEIAEYAFKCDPCGSEVDLSFFYSYFSFFSFSSPFPSLNTRGTLARLVLNQFIGLFIKLGNGGETFFLRPTTGFVGTVIRLSCHCS